MRIKMPKEEKTFFFRLSVFLPDCAALFDHKRPWSNWPLLRYIRRTSSKTVIPDLCDTDIDTLWRIRDYI